MRKLADQSTNASGEIKKIVDEIQTESQNAVISIHKGTTALNEGIGKFKETGAVFNEITEMIRNLTIHFNSVESNIEILKDGTQHMEEMMEEIEQNSKLTTNNSQNVARSVAASSAEQLSSIEYITNSAETLSKIAEELQDLTKTFKV